MIRRPYLIFVGDIDNARVLKTALGVRDWARAHCIGQWRTAPNAFDLGLPDQDPVVARAAGAGSLLIGAAPIGGAAPETWIECFVEALDAGLDIVSGLHQRLSLHPVLSAAAKKRGRVIHDVRHSDRDFPIATGRRRTGKRLLTVGTDCALGKKYTALAIAETLKQKGVSAEFRATGQTGIMIAGEGIAIDAVVADFAAGAAEMLSPDAPQNHWDIVEGQGSLFHPAYAGVTLSLLHGTQADALVLCHDPMRTVTSFYPDFPIPSLQEAMDAYLPLARRTNPAVRFIGISLNTSSLSADAARELADMTSASTGLVVFDPMRFGIDSIASEILAWR